MVDLAKIRAEILEELWILDDSGKIPWTFVDDSDSAQAAISNDSELHLDKRPSAAGGFKIWIFGPNSETVDSFEIDDLANYVPEVGSFTSFDGLVDSLYRKVENINRVKDVNSILQSLRSMRSND